MFLTMSSYQSLLEEIDREQRFKHVLEQSIRDLEHTISQLDGRLSGDCADSANEWKLRYMTQAQLLRCLRQLEKERDNLRCDVRDHEWRLDQESKAFHKFDESRKAYQTEIQDAMANLETLRSKVKMISNDYIMFNKRKGNILPNHRVLDPKRGPIKKIAAVRSLPKLNSEDRERTSGNLSE
ncbi:exonuclease 3'-5' domain-containing protein 2-like [Tropilaelaps mercedesae]|uniref:Exonuclease 3'-5' domain-containing protein 2-like n=1 Tax=Tropilaelaps mercedesae TaxID=418985 RepID=A0A1V9XZP3_9ACAR|nr:exonuclease 3'-5' domain-containing protein 2-like [Tropilaelaps mercedesae]